MSKGLIHLFHTFFAGLVMITVVKTPKRIFSGCHGLRRQTQVAQGKIDEGFQARFLVLLELSALVFTTVVQIAKQK